MATIVQSSQSPCHLTTLHIDLKQYTKECYPTFGIQQLINQPRLVGSLLHLTIEHPKLSLSSMASTLMLTINNGAFQCLRFLKLIARNPQCWDVSLSEENEGVESTESLLVAIATRYQLQALQSVEIEGYFGSSTDGTGATTTSSLCCLLSLEAPIDIASLSHLVLRPSLINIKALAGAILSFALSHDNTWNLQLVAATLMITIYDPSKILALVCDMDFLGELSYQV